MRTFNLGMLAAGAALALTGACAPMQTGPMTTAAPFMAEDFAWSSVRGRNTINGSVALQTSGRGAYTCAGSTVGLTPETDYSRQRIQILYGSSERAVLPVAQVRSRTVVDPGADFGRFVRTTTCDARGNFSFTGLPDGGWFVVGRAVPVQGGGPDEALALVQRVEVAGGITRTVTLD